MRRAVADVVVLSGVRTAIGDFGGALKECSPITLASLVVKAAISRSGIDPATIGHCLRVMSFQLSLVISIWLAQLLLRRG